MRESLDQIVVVGAGMAGLHAAESLRAQGYLGGLTIGHTAYLISQGGRAPVEERQRLFMNWAFCWRTKRRKEQELQYLTIDPHSPAEFRANIVRNLDEFHEVFGTAEGDGLWLDPSQRVRIW